MQKRNKTTMPQGQATRPQGHKATRPQGHKATRQQGNKATRQQGNKATRQQCHKAMEAMEFEIPRTTNKKLDVVVVVGVVVVVAVAVAGVVVVVVVCMYVEWNSHSTSHSTFMSNGTSMLGPLIDRIIL